MFALLPLLASANPVFIEGLYYNLDTSSYTAEVTNNPMDYGSYSGSISIPSTVTYKESTYTVTSIGMCSFDGCASLTSVTIPYSVNSIGQSAFMACTNLTSVNIPYGVTFIGERAFNDCALTSVTIPNSVTSIGDWAFEGCWGLTSVIVEMQNCITIPDGCFNDISTTCTLSVPQGEIEDYIEKGWTTGIFRGGITEHVSLWGDATMKYGAAVPQRLYNMTEGASIQGTPSISTNATSFSHVGAYPILVSKGTANAEGLDMYFYDGVLTIEKAPLKVTAKSYTIKQGDPLPNFVATYSGFKNKQTASVLTKQPVFTTISSSAVPGVYDIEVSDAEAENYAFTYVKGKLTIEDVGREAYANLSNGVLTFCFDAQKSSRTGKTYTLNTGDTAPAWLNDLSGVTKVVFDNAFAQVRPTSTYCWFDGADKVETIEGIGNLNTSEVTNMANMFQKCRLVESLDLSGWNTAKVTNMANMFATCTKLGSLDLSSFDTQEVTNMTNMFSGCTALASLDLSGWNTKKVTRMNGMFASCSALTALDVKHFDTQNVTNMSRMFYNCKKLPKVSINTWNTQKVTTMKELFAGCSKMTSVNMQGMNMRKVKDMSLMFSGCSSLESLDMIDCETFATTDMNHMFSGCTSLTRLVLNSFDTFSVTDMSYMFANCTNLETINSGEYWDTESVSNSEGMFENCEKLVGAQGTVYNDGYTDKDYARLDGGSAAPGYLSGVAEAYVVANEVTVTVIDEWGNSWEDYEGLFSFFFDEKKSSRTGMVYELNAAGQAPGWNSDESWKVNKYIINPSFRNYQPVTTHGWFKWADSIEGLEYLNIEDLTDISYMFEGCRVINLDLSGLDTHNVKNMSNMFANCSSLANLNLSSFDTHNVTDMSNMFANCSSLANLNLSSFDTHNVTDMSGMFANCSSLRNLNLSSFDTHNVTDMGGTPWQTTMGMFSGCTSLTSLDLSGFDTGNVIDMEYMFSGCTGLTSLDLSGFDTRNVTSMYGMFYGCSMKDIDLSSFDTGKVCSFAQMFENASFEKLDLKSFKVQSGQQVAEMFMDSKIYELDLSGWDLTYLMGDLYLTNYASTFGDFEARNYIKVLKLNNTILPKDLNLADYPQLTTLEMNGCDASGLSSMKFENCSYLQSIELTITSAPTTLNLQSCFKNCSNLQTVKLSIPSSAIISDLSSAFEGCTRLQAIDLSSCDLSKTTNTTNMFSGCRRLQTIYSNQTVAAENSDGMFTDCLRLTGGEGTALDDDHLDASYACVDGGDSAPGYFTAKAVPYMMMNDAEMTFYYDGQNFSRQEDGYKKYAVLDTPSWSNDANMSFVKNVTFDASFADYQPTTTADWFAGASTLKTITGLENLQTSSVESMKGMFENCYSVTSLDLSGFSTDNVTDMTDLFKNCFSLSTLDMSEWTLTNFTPMESLRDCFNLKSLTMQNVWMPADMSGMFKDMNSLTTLNLSGSLTDAITDFSELFYGCSSLTDLDLTDCNTSNVVSMSGMFSGCTSMQKLDVSGWDLSNVRTTEDMFNGCSSLRTILCDDSWDASNVVTSTSMFAGCTSLRGSKGTIFDAAYTDKTYARIDGGSSAPGYLSDEEPGIDTYIESVSQDATLKGVYSLDGQKLNKKPTKKGVFIINGRKVVVK